MTGVTSTVGAGGADAEATLRSQPAPSTVTNTSTIRKPSKFQLLRFRRTLRSTMQARRTSVRWFFCQHALNSCTQGSVSRPCRIHLSSAGVSLKLIFNMLFSSGFVSEKSLCGRKDDCVDMRVISSSAPHLCSCCTSPGARVPPAASRPGRSREFRHARCESQTLAHEFLPKMAHCCDFLPRRLTDECFLAWSEHS